MARCCEDESCQVASLRESHGRVLWIVLGINALIAYKVFHPVMPSVETMGVIGTIALLANVVCFWLLYRHRGDNLNMSSTWLCSRNDVIANVAVLVAAGSAYLLASRWPDIIVGCIIAALFLRSAFSVLRDASRAVRLASYAS